LFCLSVIVLARLCVFGTAMSIKKLFFVFFFIKVMSGRLKGTVLSVRMLRLQYSIIIIIIIIAIIFLYFAKSFCLSSGYQTYGYMTTKLHFPHTL